MESIDIAKKGTVDTWTEKGTRFTRSSKNMKVIKGFSLLGISFFSIWKLFDRLEREP